MKDVPAVGDGSKAQGLKGSKADRARAVTAKLRGIMEDQAIADAKLRVIWDKAVECEMAEEHGWKSIGDMVREIWGSRPAPAGVPEVLLRGMTEETIDRLEGRGR